MEYEIVRNQPAAKFYYKGTHSHPVKRTILVTEQSPSWLTGYEIREGATLRDLDDAPVKTFSKDKIATFGQIRNGNKTKKNVSTLTRMGMSEVAKVGF